MTHKLPWLLLSGALAVAGFGLARLTGPSPSHPPAANTEEVTERLQKLESRLPELQRSMVRVGAQLGAVALQGGTAAAAPEPAAAPFGTPAERAAKELAHYQRLDGLIRAGGGAATSAQLRRNAEQAGKGPGDPKGLALELSRVDCSDALCRVELRMKGPRGLTAIDAARALGHGMGGVTMRPREPGKPDVFYVAAPGQRLPSPQL